MNNNSKKNIKIKFVDFAPNEKKFCTFLTNILSKYYKVEISDNPDYVFFGLNSHNHLDYDCIRILFCGENFCPDFNIADYAIGLEYMTFRDRYIRFPFFLTSLYYESFLKAIDREKINLFKKSKFCSFVYSNSWGDGFRRKLFDKISEYKKVDSGGKFLNNIGGPVENKYEFDLEHKFSIACENSSCPGYTTEKIVQAFAAKTIPIYWGDPCVEREFNSKSFINCNNRDLDDILEEIKRIDNDDEIYLAMLKEKTFLGNPDEYYEDLESFLCNIFNQPKEVAFRRDRVMFGAHHEFKLRLMNRFIFKPFKLLSNVAEKLMVKKFFMNIIFKFRGK